MDIIKVFGDNLRKYRTAMEYHKKHLLKSVVCTVRI